MSVDVWRSPLAAHPEVSYGMRGDDPDVFWYVEEQNLGRFQQGLACSQCCEVFPCPPSVATLSRFDADYFREGLPGDLRSVMRQRIARGECPACGCEVSPDMFLATHQGVR